MFETTFITTQPFPPCLALLPSGGQRPRQFHLQWMEMIPRGRAEGAGVGVERAKGEVERGKGRAGEKLQRKTLV